MIDINKLRRLAQATVNVPDGTSITWIKHLQIFQQEVGATVVLELLDRLEAAESDALEQARLNGMGSEREASLMAKLEAAEKERDRLLSIVDKFGDGIDWIQRAMQAEAEVDRYRWLKARNSGSIGITTFNTDEALERVLVDDDADAEIDAAMAAAMPANARNERPESSGPLD